MKITYFLGGAERDFEMTFDLAHAFERDNRKSLYGVHTSFVTGDWRVQDVAEIIRLGLVGGGMDEYETYGVVETYVKALPLAPSVKLAQLILAAALMPPEDPVKEEIDRVFGAEDDGYGGAVQ